MPSRTYFRDGDVKNSMIPDGEIGNKKLEWPVGGFSGNYNAISISSVTTVDLGTVTWTANGRPTLFLIESRHWVGTLEGAGITAGNTTANVTLELFIDGFVATSIVCYGQLKYWPFGCYSYIPPAGTRSATLRMKMTVTGGTTVTARHMTLQVVEL